MIMNVNLWGGVEKERGYEMGIQMKHLALLARRTHKEPNQGSEGLSDLPNTICTYST